MDTTQLIFLFLAVGVVAFLYSSVGHAGASGYIATMTLLGFRRSDPATTTTPGPLKALSLGAGLGFLSGLTGTGAGIFLTPLLLFCRWARIKQAAAVSALFILVNSIGGLAGYFTKQHSIPSLGFVLAAAAIIGGTIGSRLGSRHFPSRTISILLAIVLTIAEAKLIFTR